MVLTSVAVFLIAAAVTVKTIWFPSAKDAWFQLGQQKLRQVPAGKVVVRPTHFSSSSQSGTTFVNRRMVGRNVTFKELIAVAYGENSGRVALPSGAPKNNFDFLVTALSNQQGLLREAVQKKTGYTAQKEMRDTDVLALKIEDQTLPGLKISDADEKQNTNFKNGRLYFTHTKLAEISGGLEGVLKMPVVDKTGLTGFYDFSLAWRAGMNPNNLSRDDLDKILAEWGLGFEPDTASIEMLVVEKAK
jgi:uncharacterized protein (TIGR03435 family)